jgi:UDP-glucose 4-epimerase
MERWAMTRNSLSGKHVMITGGLGMIGSTLAHRLVAAGASVTLVDNCMEPYGANLHNVAGIRSKVRIRITDIRDKEAMKSLVRGKDIVFNLAGQVSHSDSLQDPYLDADINYLGHLNVLEGIRRHSPKAVVLYAGSRLQYGKIERVPVDESHPLAPLTPYALNKTVAESMYRFYYTSYGIRCVLFRIANPYGPRSQMKHSRYSMVNWVIRQAMENKRTRIFGDGRQVRDYIYVEDLADAFLTAAGTPAAYGRVFNIGSGEGTSFRDMVHLVLTTVGTGSAAHVPWPRQYVDVETGDYVTDITKFRRATGWLPAVSMEEGIRRTYAYYQKHRSHYWV